MDNHIYFLPDQDVFNIPAKCNFEEMLEAKEGASYRAAIIFDDLPPGASRKDFIRALRAALPALGPRLAERAVDAVIRTRTARPHAQFGPHPTDIFALVRCPKVDAQQVQLRKTAINMILEKRAARPKHDPVSVEFEDRIESRRSAVGMPSGLLRTVDYEPGAAHSPPTWLVKGVFPNRGLGLLVGESQSGKSFLAINAAICVARGLPFFGKKTKPGAVLYIAAEGGSGVLPRIRAADEAIGALLPDNHMLRPAGARATAPIKVVVETPNLSRDGDTAALTRTLHAAARAFEQDGQVLSFVLVDTWHAALGGADEQAAADAGHALKPLRDAAEALGIFVLIVHHPGKDLERGARGSSALRAAVDTELEIRVPGFDGPKAKPAGMPRRVTLTKQRDGAVGAEMHFRLNVVELGKDDDGDPWTTCTVLSCEVSEIGVPGKGLNKADARLRSALTSSMAECGQDRVELRMVRGYFNNAGEADEKDEARRKSFRRALDKAVDARLIETDSVEQFIWFSNAARDAGQRDTL